MQYNFSIDRIVEQVLPQILRKPKMLAWVRVLASPLGLVYNAIMQDYRLNRAEINKNGQVIVLKATLMQYSTSNSGFMPVFIDSNISAKIHVEEYPYNVELLETVQLQEKFIDADIVQVELLSEGFGMQAARVDELESPYDFQVRVHKSLINDFTLKTVRSVVDKYKVQGRTYNVIIYQ